MGHPTESTQSIAHTYTCTQHTYQHTHHAYTRTQPTYQHTKHIKNTCSRSKIGYPAESNPLQQLDVVGNFVSDLGAIIRSHKVEAARRTNRAEEAQEGQVWDACVCVLPCGSACGCCVCVCACVPSVQGAD